MMPSDPDIIISRLAIQFGNQTIQGKVMEKVQAHATYHEALDEGKGAIIIEENTYDKDLLKVMVGNILPGQEVKIELELLRTLEVEGGAYCIRIPMTYFPKYGSSLSLPDLNLDQG